MFEVIKHKFDKPNLLKASKSRRVSNVFAYSRKSRDSSMARLINIGNSSHRESIKSSADSIKDLFEAQMRTIQSSFNTIDLNSFWSKPTFDKRDRSVQLMSNEFSINNWTNMNTIWSHRVKSIRMRHRSLAGSSKVRIYS